jgi:hypothetical protein
MKKLFTSILVFVFLFAGPFVLNIFADTPPDPGGGPGSGDLPVGGGAPIGGGLLLMFAMGAYYGIKRVIQARKA